MDMIFCVLFFIYLGGESFIFSTSFRSSLCCHSVSDRATVDFSRSLGETLSGCHTFDTRKCSGAWEKPVMAAMIIGLMKERKSLTAYTKNIHNHISVLISIV